MSEENKNVVEIGNDASNEKTSETKKTDWEKMLENMMQRAYDEAPINIGDIIKTIECSEEGRWSKDQNGDWQQDNSDKESILKKWSFVRDEAKEDE